jgi:hypothetical protein
LTWRVSYSLFHRQQPFFNTFIHSSFHPWPRSIVIKYDPLDGLDVQAILNVRSHKPISMPSIHDRNTWEETERQPIYPRVLVQIGRYIGDVSPILVSPAVLSNRVPVAINGHYSAKNVTPNTR